MADVSKVFSNEEVVEKVLGAESKEKAKEIIKEAAPEMSDADLEAAAGGMSTIAKVAIGIGSAAVIGSAAAYYGINRARKSGYDAGTRDQEFADSWIFKNNPDAPEFKGNL